MKNFNTLVDQAPMIALEYCILHINRCVVTSNGKWEDPLWVLPIHAYWFHEKMKQISCLVKKCKKYYFTLYWQHNYRGKT
jgi:hypothetical protein